MSVEPFLDVCNAYGAEKCLDVSFFFDDEEGWFAKFGVGKTSALVSAVRPHGNDEPTQFFMDRVYGLCDKAIAKAQKKQAKRERLKRDIAVVGMAA